MARPAEIALKPRSLDHVQVAEVPISALTAWQAVFERARLARDRDWTTRADPRGAAGGARSFAVEFARWRGAHVIGTASANDLDFVRELGTDEVLDYERRFEDTVHAEVVVDTVGGKTLEHSWGVLKKGSTLVTIAAQSEGAKDPAVRDAFFIVAPSRAQLSEIARLIDAGQIRPMVDAVFPLAQARQAYEHKATRGKVVLRVFG